MKNNVKISESEMLVMEIIWQLNDWTAVNTILSKMSKCKKWKYNTVATFVLRLAEKGFLESRKNNGSNEYRPLISKEEYKRQETEYFLESIHNGSRKSLIASLYQDKLTEDEFNELLKFIDGK